MLTKTGARLLDFGLARLTGHGEQPAVESLTSAPTRQAPLTGQGTILGTLPYMAPEQIEGKPADARTDLWALGTILYEMVTGTRAFEASTPVSLVGAILEREPAPLRERQPLTPPSLERLVRRCLAKDPDERWDTAHDVAVRLREIAEADTESEVRRMAPIRRRWTIPAMVALAVVAFVAGILAERLWLRSPESSRAAPVVRSEIDLTADRPLRSPFPRDHPFRRELALSRDGTLLVWAGRPDDDWTRNPLHLRRMTTGEVTRLPGTERASQPFFSPDGRWVGFSALGSGPGSGCARSPSREGSPSISPSSPDYQWGPHGKRTGGSCSVRFAGVFRGCPPRGALPVRSPPSIVPARAAIAFPRSFPAAARSSSRRCRPTSAGRPGSRPSRSPAGSARSWSRTARMPGISRRATLSS